VKGFNLTDALLGRGYKKEDIAKLWGGNMLRLMRAVIG
jgi:membrane dipeptidase